MPRSQKILVIRNSALGDVAMTLPVLYSVARRYPEVEFCLLTRPFFGKIFIDAPANLRIIAADYKGAHRGFVGILRLLSELAKERFTAVADLHNVLRSWIIDAYMRLRGCRVAMVDKMRSRRLSAESRSDQPSFIDRYAQVFARLGVPVELDFVSVFESLPQSQVAVKHPAVGIAPFARYENKTYPPRLMEQVVADLVERGINVYLFGSKGDEAAVLDSWAQRYKGCVSLAGKMDISAELGVMAQTDVMVTMDSANQHLASIVGVPVVSIWGATVPGCGFYGYHQDRDNAICLGIDCQPCSVAGSPACPKGICACLQGIAPSTVVEKVLKVLPNKSS